MLTALRIGNFKAFSEMPNPFLPIPEMSVNLFRARPTKAKPEWLE